MEPRFHEGPGGLAKYVRYQWNLDITNLSVNEAILSSCGITNVISRPSIVKYMENSLANPLALRLIEVPLSLQRDKEVSRQGGLSSSTVKPANELRNNALKKNTLPDFIQFNIIKMSAVLCFFSQGWVYYLEWWRAIRQGKLVFCTLIFLYIGLRETLILIPI